MAFKTDATQQIKMLGYPTVNLIFFNIRNSSAVCKIFRDFFVLALAPGARTRL
jgi:hypothetical protein